MKADDLAYKAGKEQGKEEYKQQLVKLLEEAFNTTYDTSVKRGIAWAKTIVIQGHI